jgi:Protein of unknown function (DUF2934)
MEHTSLEQRIRERAYEIWNAHGRANGNAHDHWFAAEREVFASFSARSPNPETSTPKKARSSTRQRKRLATTA